MLRFIFCCERRIAMVFKDREQKQSLFGFHLISISHLILWSSILVSSHRGLSLQLTCMSDWWTLLCSLLHCIVKRGL
ncbi:hypothetical protein BJX76DRAFT_328176 [Aspergillus varians]